MRTSVRHDHNPRPVVSFWLSSIPEDPSDPAQNGDLAQCGGYVRGPIHVEIARRFAALLVTRLQSNRPAGSVASSLSNGRVFDQIDKKSWRPSSTLFGDSVWVYSPRHNHTRLKFYLPLPGLLGSREQTADSLAAMAAEAGGRASLVALVPFITRDCEAGRLMSSGRYRKLGIDRANAVTQVQSRWRLDRLLERAVLADAAAGLVADPGLLLPAQLGYSAIELILLHKLVDTTGRQAALPIWMSDSYSLTSHPPKEAEEMLVAAVEHLLEDGWLINPVKSPNGIAAQRGPLARLIRRSDLATI